MKQCMITSKESSKKSPDIEISILGPCTTVLHGYEDISVELVTLYCTIKTVHDKCEWVKK